MLISNEPICSYFMKMYLVHDDIIDFSINFMTFHRLFIVSVLLVVLYLKAVNHPANFSGLHELKLNYNF